jgi:hypothetical protein
VQNNNRCFKCDAKKATKFGQPKSRGEDSVQRVRCDSCGQMRYNVIKPRKKKESKDGPNSDNQPTDS